MASKAIFFAVTANNAAKTVCGLGVLGVIVLMGAPAKAELVFGLTTANSLVTFDTATPNSVSSALAITGLGANETLFDIDIRPANNLLYGFSNAGNLYSINTTTGAASLSASLTGVNLDPNATRFGIDFNPTVDRLRIVSNTGQDLRLTPDTGLTTVDTNLNGADSGAVSVAYTNSVANAPSMSLFYIGATSSNRILYSTTNPNGGVMTTVGFTNVTSTANVGFDISGVTGNAYLTMANPSAGTGFSSLYSLNVSTGAASLVGAVGTGVALRGIALSSSATAPEPGSLALLLPILGAFGMATRRRKK